MWNDNNSKEEAELCVHNVVYLGILYSESEVADIVASKKNMEREAGRLLD